MIELDNVHKAFGKKEILRGLELTIGPTETFVIIGRSGIGKSVTLKHIVGLLHPTQGVVRVFGHDLAELPREELKRHRRKIGYLFQDGALLNWMNIEDNVALPLREHDKIPKSEVEERVLETLDLVELRDHRHKLPSEISGGMRKRAGLARALVTKPKIVLYDEPTSGLDPISSSIINELICDMQKQLQIAQVVVTHDMTSAFHIADRIGLLHEGTLVAVGTPEEIRSSSFAAVDQFIHGKITGPLSRGATLPPPTGKKDQTQETTNG